MRSGRDIIRMVFLMSSRLQMPIIEWKRFTEKRMQGSDEGRWLEAGSVRKKIVHSRLELKALSVSSGECRRFSCLCAEVDE